MLLCLTVLNHATTLKSFGIGLVATMIGGRSSCWIGFRVLAVHIRYLLNAECLFVMLLLPWYYINVFIGFPFSLHQVVARTKLHCNME